MLIYSNSVDYSSIEKLFEFIDKDGSGKVSAGELSRAMKECGLNYSDQEIKDIISAVDQNHDGMLDMEELKKALMNH
ncbi:unnamed protein product [Protopolystoma xenopodis]|uniref:EF-hand domain-containing protein n=1 Tax=Protopolystoma xenopodis TaxID=117903 RepID=A0A3S5AY37_9PLAT|nr:unnamed protein product [Protopolystoma xenopodis]